MQPTDTTELRSLFVAGVKNAHAMENQALSIMKPQAKRIENYPEVEERLRQHIDETESQIERLDTILADLGEDRSAVKDTALSLGGAMAAVGHTAAPDEIVKNSFANFAFENYEAAAYKSLIALAEAGGGMGRAVSLLKQTLSEEEAMANWLDEHLVPLTMKYASLRETGETAKR